MSKVKSGAKVEQEKKDEAGNVRRTGVDKRQIKPVVEMKGFIKVIKLLKEIKLTSKVIHKLSDDITFFMTCDDQISNTSRCHTNPEITVILTYTEKSLSYKLVSIKRQCLPTQNKKRKCTKSHDRHVKQLRENDIRPSTNMLYIFLSGIHQDIGLMVEASFYLVCDKCLKTV